MCGGVWWCVVVIGGDWWCVVVCMGSRVYSALYIKANCFQAEHYKDSIVCLELQFQLLMGGSSGIPPAATQDELELSGGGGSRSLALISHLSGVPPLQAEILDNEIKELQATLHEAKSRNVYLSNLVEQQKKYV